MKDELGWKIETVFVRLRSKTYSYLSENGNSVKISNNDEKRLHTFDRTTSYPYGASVGKVCKWELVNVVSKTKWWILII